MKINIVFYLMAAAVVVLALIAGFGRIPILFITNMRIAVIVLAAAGFSMCCAGAIGHFIVKAPTHILTIAGYMVGLVALFAGIVQLFNINVPVFREPMAAMIIITASIAVKAVIARFAFVIN